MRLEPGEKLVKSVPALEGKPQLGLPDLVPMEHELVASAEPRVDLGGEPKLVHGEQRVGDGRSIPDSSNEQAVLPTLVVLHHEWEVAHPIAACLHSVGVFHDIVAPPHVDEVVISSL